MALFALRVLYQTLSQRDHKPLSCTRFPSKDHKHTLVIRMFE
jgi:hypothetical protein